MRRAWKLLPGLVVPLLTGCRDDRTEADGDSTGTVSDSMAESSSTVADSATADSTTDAPDPDSSSSVGSDETPCATQICGDECCDDDEECVLAACLPVCTAGVRCGAELSVCCGENEVCLQPDCVAPGAECFDSYDCPAGEFCEPNLGEHGQCLPNPGRNECEIVPDFGEIEPVLEWSFESDQVITMPAIGDIDGDGLPEVVANSIYVGGEVFAGEIIVLDGQTGAEEFRIVDDPASMSFGSYSRSTPALGDVDGNGLADIVYSGLPTGDPAVFNYSVVHAVNGLGQHLWQAHDPNGADHYIYTRNGAALLTNLDDDDESEVVYGIAVIDHDGLVVSDDYMNALGHGAGVFGSNGTYEGGIATSVDLTGDGYPEIVSGREAWTVDWTQEAVGMPTVSVSPFWPASTDPDGYPAVADLDDDGDPEVVVVGEGFMRVLEGDTGELWCGADVTGALCSGNDAARTQPIELPSDGLGGSVGRGGPPTIADFDGDGRVEIGVAGGSAYTVFDFNREGEEVVQPLGMAPPGPGDAYARWIAVIQDESSNVTGSSVFDFQGDGSAEVMYQDECYLRVFDGATGTVLLELENSTPTIHEYPVVADVDADGNTEFVVVAGDSNPELCMANVGYTPRRGVFVYGDANDFWVPTRQVWTQHTYHVTNATSLALTPAAEDANWLQDELNNFRQNVQGEGIFNAPDLSLDVSVGLQSCLDEQFEIFVTVRNEGLLGVPAGIEVTLYEGTDASGGMIGTMFTQTPLLPGAFEQLEWVVGAPARVAKTFYAAVDGGGSIAECIEDNNDGTTQTVACPTPG